MPYNVTRTQNVNPAADKASTAYAVIAGALDQFLNPSGPFDVVKDGLNVDTAWRLCLKLRRSAVRS